MDGQQRVRRGNTIDQRHDGDSAKARFEAGQRFSKCGFQMLKEENFLAGNSRRATDSFAAVIETRGLH